MDFSPLYLSIQIAVVSTLFVAITSLVLAQWIRTRRVYGKSVIEALILLPMVLPPTVVGFVLILLFGLHAPLGSFLNETLGIKVVFTWVGAAIAAFVVSLPLMYQSTVAAFEKVDSRFENAARTMGVSEWNIFRRITLPLAWPGLIAGLLLAFTRGLGEFGATLMIAGYIPGQTATIPLEIYFSYEAGDMETATFWVVVVSLIGFAMITWINYWRNKMEKRQRRRS